MQRTKNKNDIVHFTLERYMKLKSKLLQFFQMISFLDLHIFRYHESQCSPSINQFLKSSEDFQKGVIDYTISRSK